MLYLLLTCLFCIVAALAVVWPSDIIPGEIKREESWEDAEAHHKGTLVISTCATPILVRNRLISLPLWAPWDITLCVLLLLSRIVIVPSCVYRDDGVGGDAGLAHRTDQGVSRLVHPRVDARPAVQMTTLAHDRLFSCI